MASHKNKSNWDLQFLLILISGPVVINSAEEYSNSESAPPPANSKVIVYWNQFFSSKDFGWGLGNFTQHCPVYNNCYATRDRDLVAVENFDAIIFHGFNGQFNINDIPEKRTPNQKYVFVALESPVSRYAPREQRCSHFFDIRVTYRWDSEVIWSYADIREKRSKKTVVPSKNGTCFNSTLEGTCQVLDDDLERILQGKSKLAIWYVSHCRAHSGRDQYVEELKKYIPVSVFGKCAPVRGCPRSENCFKKEVEPEYFFYLSFENSLCDDYVTEKFFNTLKYYVVPVVYGGANYAKFAPSKSYINALDFDSPKELAEHLRRLSENITEYKTYFEWKNHYEIISSHKKRVVCELCEILNKGGHDFKEVTSWYNDRKNQCPLQVKLDIQRKNGSGELYATKKTWNFS